jgi:fluoroacetyl-CoA thioesterase
VKSSLVVGLTGQSSFVVSEANTVPRLAIEQAGFSDIPPVLATAYMIAMMEGASAQVLRPHLDPGEGSLGTVVNVNHTSATLVGQTVTVTAEITAVQGRRITFKVTAHDGLDQIGTGTHERAIVPWDRMGGVLDAKRARIK